MKRVRFDASGVVHLILRHKSNATKAAVLGMPFVQPGDRVVFGPSHEHVWVIGRVETESVYYPGTVIPQWGRVAYLVCQCGAVKRVVPE